MQSFSGICVSGKSLDGRLTFVPRYDPGFEFDAGQVRPVRNLARMNKPIGGFWASVDDGWERWCASEMPEWLGRSRYSVKLRDDAIICVISGIDDLDLLPREVCSGPLAVSGHGAVGVGIDFEALSHMCDGVIVDIDRGGPELYNEFYGWDCSSVCIFHADAVAGLSPSEPYLNKSGSRDLGLRTPIDDCSWDDDGTWEDFLP